MPSTDMPVSGSATIASRVCASTVSGSAPGPPEKFRALNFMFDPADARHVRTDERLIVELSCGRDHDRQCATMDGSHDTNGRSLANAGTKGRFPACSVEPARCLRHKVMHAAKACLHGLLQPAYR